MGGKNNFAIAAQGQVISLSEVRRAGRLPFALPTKEKGLLLAPIPVARAYQHLPHCSPPASFPLLLFRITVHEPGGKPYMAMFYEG